LADKSSYEYLSQELSSVQKATCDDPVMFKEIYNSINEFIFEHDLNGVFLGICPRFVGFLGYSREEMIGMNVKSMLPEKYLKQFDTYINRVVEHGRDEGLIQLVAKTGRKRIVEHKNYLAVHPDGTKTIQGIARDVTDVLETEQALIESEIRFRSILDSIEDGYFEVDLGGNLTFFNDIIPNQLGYTYDQCIGLNYKKYVDDANAKRVFETFHNVFLTNTPTKSVDWELFKKDGTKMYVEASVSLQRDRDGNPIGFCGIVRDCSERKRTEQELAYLAYHDALTGLHNRKAFIEKLDEVLREARRYENYRSILFIDLDHFKRVNDIYGHEIGDKLLVQVAKRLKDILRDTDYTSRLGGDEFTIILGGPAKPNLEKVALRILKCLSKPYIIQGTKIDFVTPSIGSSTYPDDGHDVETLLKHADSAMYKAKEKRNSFVSYNKNESPPSALRQIKRAR
jgi:diguanylate cyclase (GGDEF)-like protein/PAS domain S-box-containing protein